MSSGRKNPLWAPLGVTNRVPFGKRTLTFPSAPVL